MPIIALAIFNVTFSGNHYWFGLRKPPFQALFAACPCLQLFGNISYSLYGGRGGGSGSSSAGGTSLGDASSSGAGGSSSDDTSVAVDLASSPLSSTPAVALVSSGGKKSKSSAPGKKDQLVAPAMALEMPD